MTTPNKIITGIVTIGIVAIAAAAVISNIRDHKTETSKLKLENITPSIIVNLNTGGVVSPTKGQILIPTPMQDITELKIEDLVVGTGNEVKSGDTIVINYQGTLIDGTEFDNSYKRGKPFETQIGVGRVIKGWDEGVLGMKVGGKRRLLIPANLAYGEQGVPGAIAPNTPLIFTVELISIK